MSRSLRHVAANGFFWSVVETAGGQAFSVVVFLALARLLTPADFGLVALAMIYIRLLLEPLDQGLADAVVQRDELDPRHVDSAFWLSLACTIALGVASILLAHPVAALLNEPRLAPIIQVLSVALPLAGLRSAQQALLRRHLHFRVLAMRTLAATVAGGLVGVALAWSGFGVWSLVGQRVTTSLVAVVVLWGISDWRPGLRVSFPHVRDLMGFTLNRTGTKLLLISSRRIPELMIGYLMGPVALGFFTVAQRLVQSLLHILTVAITQVALPAFSRLQREPERVRRAFYLVTRVSGVIGFPTFLGLAVLAPRLVPFAFGPQWTESVPVMQLLAIVAFTQCVGAFNSVVITAMGKPHWQLGMSALNVALTVVLIALAAPYGIAAVAWTFVVRGLLLSPLTGFAARRIIHYEFGAYVRQFVAPVIGALTMSALLLALGSLLDNRMPDGAVLGLQVAAGLVAYLAVLRVLAPALLSSTIELGAEALPRALRRRRLPVS